MKALIAALALSVGSAAGAEPCTGPVCNFGTLAPYFAKLAAAHPAKGEPPLHILQIGDSLTAGDVMTAGWRDLLQAQEGNGGRGVLPPGRPYEGYITHGVTASMSPGWSIAATFGKGSAAPRPPLGLSSYSLTSTMPGVTMELATDPELSFDRFVVCAVARYGSGPLMVRMGNGTSQTLILGAMRPTPRCETVRTATPQTWVLLTAPGAPVTITSWATFDDDGGIVLSNLGVVGSQLQHFGRTDDALLTEELRAYAPDLIVLSFGTNEGFVPRFDARAYETTLRSQIERVRGLAPGVPLLLLGPPDGLSRNPQLRNNADGVIVGCPDAGGSPPLFAPPALALVRAIQRRVADDLDVAWWDWYARTGGPCSAARWAAADPPLMRPDHVHFRASGGMASARLLQDDLNRAAEAH